MDGLLGVAGMIITSDYGSFPDSQRFAPVSLGVTSLFWHLVASLPPLWYPLLTSLVKRRQHGVDHPQQEEDHYPTISSFGKGT